MQENTATEKYVQLFNASHYSDCEIAARVLV